MWLVSLLRDENILRQSRAVVTIVDAPRGVKERATVTTTAQAMFSRPNQLINGISHTTGKIATFEPDFWRLDGSFMLPVTPPHSQLEIGFASSQMSNIRGDFNTPPEITVNFSSPQSLPLISLMFDHTTGEAAESVRFRAFNASGGLLLDETVAGNSANYINTTRGANGATRVVITILRTVNPLRRARVAEIHFGRVMHYDGEDIAEINTVHQADPLGAALPQNRLSLKIFNKGRFSVVDGQSDARHLRERQTVEYTQGVIDDFSTKWTHCGNYFLDNWRVREKYVDFAAYGRTADLGTGIWTESTFSRYTLGRMARDVAAEAGFQVVIPWSMETSPLMPRFFGNVTVREALTIIAQLASCLLLEDGEGRIRFVDIVDAPGNMVDMLDFDKQYAPPKVGLGTFYNGVLLTETYLNVEPGLMHRIEIEVAGSIPVTIPLARPIFSGGHIVVPPGFTLTNLRFNTMYMTGTLTGHGLCKIEVHGDRAAFATSEHFYPAPWFSSAQGQHPYVVNLPMFFQNLGNPREMRNWFLRRKFALLAKRVHCEADWRQNPAISPGDRVNMQVEAAGRTLPSHVVWQELNFDHGVLRGKTRVIANQI